MPLQLKATYLQLFTLVVIFSVYGWWIFGVAGIEYFTGPEALIRIGRTIAVLIVAGYAFEITMHFIVGFFNIKVLNHTKDDFILDERDKLILLKSLTNSHYVLCTGIFLAVGALAIGWSPFWVFNLMVLAFALSVVMELATKLTHYR